MKCYLETYEEIATKLAGNTAIEKLDSGEFKLYDSCGEVFFITAKDTEYFVEFVKEAFK